MGDDEIALTKETIEWPHEAFIIPKEIQAAWNAVSAGSAREAQWQARFNSYRDAHPALAVEFERRVAGKLPVDWSQSAQAFIDALNEDAATVASRKASQMTLEGFGPLLPELAGGSADLAGSNLTIWSGSKPVSREDASGNYIYFGVREFGMAAICNGISLHGGFIPYSATFLVFSDYARNALRMAALMKIRQVFVFTHDSIGLGEDGPTHQPVEHVASLRLIPNMSLWRPCDAVETAVAWRYGIERQDGPTSLALSRQNLPHQVRDASTLERIARGGYVLLDSEDGEPEVILIATGSEVALAMDSATVLREAGRKIRVVSMPSSDVFDAQDESYRESVLPRTVSCRIAIEAGVSDGWRKYVGLDGAVIGLDRFGESAPAEAAFEYFGFTVENIVNRVNAII